MDIPSYPAAIDTTPPPPSYNEIDGPGLYPPSPPPLYTEAISLPIYKETSSAPADTFQQFPRTAEANQFPVLNMPRIEMVNYSERVSIHQMVRNEAPQVIVVQPQHFAVALGDIPTATVCQYCQKNILTVVKYKPGWSAWCMCVLISLLGLICGFCLIPFCVRGFQDAHHSCPYCHKHLGIYTRK
ncbi:lipopolysaccharide-induced tumor necrosis factor-alpha factor homolog [Misgurnus anguillicaudatus]|uniref:lipopolysaccharide-induced tumor necrosis factor-alpha factor homolog n=1 Tax=Misgurnus anguillicaudatus TaxID=75329 RepID=UPI003CCFC2A1